MEKNTFEQIVDEAVASSSPTELPVMEAKVKMGTKSPSPFTIAWVYKELKIKYGKPSGQWKLWCKRPKTEKEREEVLIGAVLTQRTNWKNVQLVMDSLKGAKINFLEDICRTGKRRLAPLIKPSGFYRVKARYLFSLAKFIVENYGNLEKMRREKLVELRGKLLRIKGIGPETADSILLYALDKPVFVIDEYTRRLVDEVCLFQSLPSSAQAKRRARDEQSSANPPLRFARVIKKRRISQNLLYDFLQKLFEKNLKRDFRLYQDFHALIVIDGKEKK